MPDLRSDVYGEEYYPVKIGQGMYTSELPSNIPDGFSPVAYNLVATGDSLENRVGLRQSSINWHKVVNGWIDDSCQIVTMNTSIAMLWAWYDQAVAGATGCTMSFIKSPFVAGGDGFAEVTMPNTVHGIAVHNGVAYFVMRDANKIYKLTNINWSTDAITYSSVPSAAAALPATSGLLSFKDRLWTWASDKLYFTELATTGTLPETWTALNYVNVNGNTGQANIHKVVPMSNKLLIFTSNGVFSLTIEGPPESWLLKILDSESKATHRYCAFESKGVCYYVNQNGVFATNGTQVAKLSGVIEDQFFLSKGKRLHTLVPFEDGMILSIMLEVNPSDSYKLDAPNCRVFYTKTDPVGWTEWNIHPNDESTNAFGDNRLVAILSASQKLSTDISVEPLTYVLALVTDSKTGASGQARIQLLVFDGGENQMRNRAGDLITEKMSIRLKTKYMDAGNPYRNKFAKKGFVELFTSDTQHQLQSSWDMDATVGALSEIRSTETIGFTVGQGSNLIQLPADFPFRRCALTLKMELQTNTSQVKIKDVAMMVDTARSEAEPIR